MCPGPISLEQTRRTISYPWLEWVGGRVREVRDKTQQHKMFCTKCFQVTDFLFCLLKEKNLGEMDRQPEGGLYVESGLRSTRPRRPSPSPSLSHAPTIFPTPYRRILILCTETLPVALRFDRCESLRK